MSIRILTGQIIPAEHFLETDHFKKRRQGTVVYEVTVTLIDVEPEVMLVLLLPSDVDLDWLHWSSDVMNVFFSDWFSVLFLILFRRRPERFLPR